MHVGTGAARVTVGPVYPTAADAEVMKLTWAGCFGCLLARPGSCLPIDVMIVHNLRVRRFFDDEPYDLVIDDDDGGVERTGSRCRCTPWLRVVGQSLDSVVLLVEHGRP
uniref:(northern house mosquito) hypothetical protein n=1 Tax=Culex pipiens TaxID=7175 RepID=A0A8D8HAB1_CULPI